MTAEQQQAWAGRLWSLRKERNLTQPQAAELSGVGAKSLSAFETGRTIEAIKVVQLQKLCDAYGVTLAQFFAEVQ